MKKKFCVLLFLLLNALSPVICADNLTMKLNEIEKTYFGAQYSGSLESRLSRLEKAIYNSVSKQPQKNRIEKIYSDLSLGTTTNIPEIKNIGPKADAGIKYPIVDKMEEEIFQKTFVNEDIYARLSRLEKQMFKKESTLSLNERVDVLRSRILEGTKNKNTYVNIDPNTEEIVLQNGRKYYGDDANTYFNNDMNGKNSNYNYYSYENSKQYIPEVQSKNSDNSFSDGGAYAEKYAQSYDLDILEKNLFGKRYSNEVPSKRLARLESKVFSRTFTDGEEARIQRLLAVTTAQKTSQEYDSNKWAQRLNAGMQIGSILLMVLAMIL